ncbi:MAG: DUF1214 domain-containing protein, partial [Caulobacteraceae bacterium]|nr:DUF1214 domain-containing protein [Caulobacteraceae bacterium]
AERAEAFRYLTQAVAQGFLWAVENETRPQHPWLLGLFNPVKKQAGDKSMSRDYGAYIDGRFDYRITGQRGSSRWIALTALTKPNAADPLSAKWNEPWALVLDSEPLLGTDVVVEPDGTMEIICSKQRPPGAKNWLRITEATNHVRVRQLFDDWNQEEPMAIHIERIGGEPGAAPPALLQPEEMIAALAKAASFVRKSTSAWGPPPLEGRVENEMYDLPTPPTRIGGIDANPGGVMSVAWWALAPDEALVIEFTPVPSLMWSVELENVWWVTADYRWRLVEVTDAQAVLEDDGRCRLVVAHKDPGVPNWLDTGTFSEGWARYRGMLSEDGRSPAWSSRRVKLDELTDILPAGAKRTTPEERKAQIALRAAGVRKRYRD